MELVSSAENSTLDWRSQNGYVENIGDGTWVHRRHHRIHDGDR